MSLQRPFVNYYSCNFILWELSSPFLNIHWFFDKLGMTGTTPQLYNGIILIVTFFSCRLCWGTYQSFLVARDIWSGLHNKPSILEIVAPDNAFGAYNVTLPAQYAQTMQYVTDSTGVPLWLAAIYIGSNLTLNSLNFYWFIKMIDAVRKRFTSKEKETQSKKEPALATDKTDEAKGVTTGIDGSLADFNMRLRLLDGEETETPPPI